MPPTRRSLLDASAIAEALARMASEIVTYAGGTDRLLLVGIQRRGVDLARRLGQLIAREHGVEPPLGALDITLYRDDLETVGPRPVIGETTLPHDLDGRIAVIVDDVLFTGRTVRAAMDEIADFGRPARIGLAVLIDRGGRELPIQADVVGRRLTDVAAADLVDVKVTEVDAVDTVDVVAGGRGKA